MNPELMFQCVLLKKHDTTRKVLTNYCRNLLVNEIIHVYSTVMN